MCFPHGNGDNKITSEKSDIACTVSVSMDYCFQFNTIFKYVCCKYDYIEVIMWGSIASHFNITMVL